MAFLVALRITTRVTELKISLPIAMAKTIGWLAIAALRQGIPRGALAAWRLWLGGGALNLVAIALGGGRMPVAPSALRATGLPPPPADHVVATTPLQVIFGDSIPVLWPVVTAVSLGDVVLTVGVVTFAAFLLRSPVSCVPRPMGESRQPR